MFDSVQEIFDMAEKSSLPVWKMIQQADVEEQNYTTEESYRQMEEVYRVMIESVEQYDGDLRSSSGYAGGAGALMEKASLGDQVLGGKYFNQVITQALKVGESNACMRRVVAAPTAGSCGVIPAILVPLIQSGEVTKEKAIESLYISAAFGQVIAQRASIAGAEGGCQAEVGSASAMGAAQLVYLRGGSLEQSAHACAMALKNLMGLVCDPVAGLVEIPCIKRNVIGAVNAISSANMALAGIVSHIPPDEVIDTMGIVGGMLPAVLRETGGGGVAVTQTGKKITKWFHNYCKQQKDGGCGNCQDD